MVLKLYGAQLSLVTRIVAAVLLEKQVPFELVLVNLSKGEQKTPEHLSIQYITMVKFLALTMIGFILYESKAICYYIASKYADQGTPMLPTGLKANALYQQAVFAQASHFDDHGMKAIREVYSKRRLGLSPDNEVFEKHIADLSDKLDVYGKILSKQKYLVGEDLCFSV